jgi:dimethylhistidine N-methyltransferase
MDKKVQEMAGSLGSGCLLIEYGCGSGIKTRILLAALTKPVGFVPIDISGEQLAATAEDLARNFPDLEVMPVCADYTEDYEIPDPRRRPSRRVVYFPGSTIGNFQPPDARKFMAHIREICGRGGGFLVGVDLKKDKAILERAYNDEAGVTAEFNLNLLRRINRELNADISVGKFHHRAFFNEGFGRIELHLVSRCQQTFFIDKEAFELAKGETIHTENSYKYELDEFAELAQAAGFRVEQVWTDSGNLFSVQYLNAL